MKGSVIFKLVGTILIALLTCITGIGTAIFKAVENPDGSNGSNSSFLDIFKNLGKKKEG